ATSSAHIEDLAYLDEQQRHVLSKTSLGMLKQDSGSRSQHNRACFSSTINLKPLQFEIPGLLADWMFTGREWLFQELDACLCSDDPETNRGVVITGNMGFGKTAVIARLVALSCHGNLMWPSASSSKTIHTCKTKKPANMKCPCLSIALDIHTFALFYPVPQTVTLSCLLLMYR
ncbi:transcript variant X2, partial [Nothobranchius furzeri]